jgi:hypothetical protein
MRAASSSLTAVIELAIGACAPSEVDLGARQPAHHAIAVPGEVELELDAHARAAPRRG